MFNEAAPVTLSELHVDLNSKQLWGGGVIAAIVHLSWKAAYFTPLSLNLSLPLCLGDAY